jgi:hypothetical protein
MRKQITGYSARVLSVIALSLSLFTVGACDDRKSMEPIEFTQCFEAFDQPRARKEIKEQFFKDSERSCYGQRWRMPRAYYDHKRVSYQPLTETVVIRVGHPGFAPGNLIPREQYVRLLNEVAIYALWNGNFQDHIRHTKKNYEVTGGLEKIGRVMYEMEVYDQLRMPKDQYRSIFFFPSEKNARLFMMCLLRPDDPVEYISPQSPHGSCKIVSSIDDRVRIEYHIKYSELPQLRQINTDLIKLVRSFMIN